MKPSLLFFWATLLTLRLATAQTNPPRLIIRGDDMGYSHAGNEAILTCYKEGIEKSIEVLVPSPWFPEAVEMLKQIPDADIGVHLTLTSEWDNIKWRPLSDCPSLRDADGYFYPMIRPNKDYPKRSVVENDWKLADIEKEFRAQIELAMKKIPRISHFSGHMGCTSLNDEVKDLVKKLAQEYHIKHTDMSLRDAGVTYTGYVGAHVTAEEKLQSFTKMLESLEPGKTYLFVDHPGLNTPEVQAIHHIGYENVAADRQGVTDIWTNPRVKQLIKDKRIQLIGYNQL
ncbi:polysaccharide deacetylase family protein [Spirosoma validum]|uniref:Polysaccharide deacetylase family protein n=1 Tax=Spirosoma validum TaxID=2771355 RepID=A0A927AX26_9BACT|nr:polysaccharide deacetylase family protein [Spirosoma validum]MBD2751414.1 polysaccharide deacetylase family protein [Spirosoma validum]